MIRTLIVAGALLAAAAPPAVAAGLDSYRWKARPVLVFAPDMRDAAAVEQMKRLRAGPSILQEREMPVLFVSPTRVTTLAGDRAPATLDAAALRKRYAIEDGGFTVILVGKDGGEKLRSTEPVDAEALTGLVDGMPMRRQEAR